MTFGPWSNPSSFTTQASGTGVLAVQSDSFAQSMGLNVHFNFGGAWDDYTNWMPTLIGMDMPNFRTTVSSAAKAKARMNDLIQGQVHPPKFLIQFNPDGWLTSSIAGDLNTVFSYGLSNIMGFELLNEINSATAKVTTSFDDRATKAIAYTQAFRQAVDAKGSAWAGIPIIGPSIWGRSFNMIDNYVLTKNGGLGWGPYCDGQPIHMYTGGRKPTICGASKDNADDNLDHTLDEELFEHQKLVQNDPNKPSWMTENGWQMDEGGYTPPQPLDAGTVTEIASSKYCSRTFLESFNRGVAHTFWYSFLNNPGNNTYQGIVNCNASAPYAPYTQRRSVATLTRLVSIMRDPGGSFTPTRLPYKFSGAGFDADFTHRLFQKRNGVFYLLCTTDKSSYKQTSPYGDLNSTASVTLDLGGSRSLVRRTTPHSTAAWTTVGSSISSCALSVPDHLMIIEITP